MTAEIFISSDAQSQAWRLYSETRTPLEEIAKLIGVKPCTFLRRRKAWGWPSRAELRMKEVPAAAKRIVEQARPKVDQKALIARIRETVEREIAEIDQSLKALDGAVGAGGLERSARTLATLVKTLTELKKLCEADKGPAAEEAYERPDMDEFRRSLTRRLEALADAWDANGGSRGDDAGGLGATR